MAVIITELQYSEVAALHYRARWAGLFADAAVYAAMMACFAEEVAQ